MTHPLIADIGSVAIVAGLAVGVAALLALHILPTGLSAVRNPVSQYGISRYRLGYRIQTLSYAVAGLGAAIGIATLPVAATLPVLLCVIFAAARGAISWFPMDEPGAAPTRGGSYHGLLAIAAFLSATLAAAVLSRTLSRGHLDATMSGISGALAAVMLVALIAMGIDRRRGGGVFGLIERVFYAGVTAWLAALAALLAIHTW